MIKAHITEKLSPKEQVGQIFTAVKHKYNYSTPSYPSISNVIVIMLLSCSYSDALGSSDDL